LDAVMGNVYHLIIDEYLTYISTVRRLSPNTVRQRAVYLPQLADDLEPLAASTEQLREWIARHDDWSPATVNVVTAALRSFYGWAVEIGRIDRDPSARLRYVQVPHRRPRIARREHLDAGLASDRLEVRVMTRLGAECGLRVHEIAKLRKDERDDEWLTIIGKGAHQRTVHLPPELRADLDELEAKHPDSPWYFPSPCHNGHLTTETLRRWSRCILATNPHSLRHRAGTTVYRGTGNNLRVTQVFLGHRNPATTAIYVHVEREDLILAGEAARLAA
jgi:integrase